MTRSRLRAVMSSTRPRRDGHALEKPDVRNRHGQFNVPHAFAADAGQGDFNAATVADDAAVLDAFILAAGAFPVLDGAENALAKQAAFFRLEGAVIDGFGVFDFALGPGADGFGEATEMATYSTWLTLSRPSNSRAVSLVFMSHKCKSYRFISGCSRRAPAAAAACSTGLE